MMMRWMLWDDEKKNKSVSSRRQQGVVVTATVEALLLLLLLLLPARVPALLMVPAFSPTTSLTTKTETITSRFFSLSSSTPKRLQAATTAAQENVSNANGDVCTIQILMSDTGGGHRASANALRDAFDVLHPGKIQVDIVDIYTDYGTVWPYNDYVEMYKLMAANPWSWDLFYRFGTSDLGMCVNAILVEMFCFDSFSKCLARPSKSTGKRADMVVSVHPLCQDVPLRILANLDSKGRTRDFAGRTHTPFCTVVTDLGSAHPTWFHPAADKCFVPSDALDQAARKRGLKSSQLVQYGLPIRKGFWYPTEEPRNALRQRLGIEESLPVCLVVGGGDGMGGIVDIAKKLGSRLGQQSQTKPTTQMVVVCGKNEQARQALEQYFWEKGVKVYVKGFVNNMDEWMKASDALVTKAGPGTIAEASICGLPCMMFSYLPGQEEGNIPFVENAGFGEYSGDPQVIADTVASWLSSPTKLASMQKAALAAARPQATLDIARDLAEIVFAAAKKKKDKEKGEGEARSSVRPNLVGATTPTRS